jgi:hypothetical protein
MIEIQSAINSFNVSNRSHLLDLSTTNNMNKPNAFTSNFVGGKKTKAKPKAKPETKKKSEVKRKLK